MFAADSPLGWQRTAAAQSTVRALVLLLGVGCCSAALAAPQEIEPLVFANARTAALVSPADRQAIAQVVPFRARNGALVDDTCGEPVSIEVEARDLNADGMPEVIVLGGNACANGMAGAALWLFIKAPSGQWQGQLGFPAGGYHVLTTRTKGWLDIQPELPGDCQPVWGWNGNAYDIVRRVEARRGACKAGA